MTSDSNLRNCKRMNKLNPAGKMSVEINKIKRKKIIKVGKNTTKQRYGSV